MVRKKKTDSLLTFDENSPLFVKKKQVKRTKKPRNVKSKPIVEDVVLVDEPTTKPKEKRTTKKKVVVNPHAPKYTIKSPADCKHILPSFKKMLLIKWKLLESGNPMEADSVASYIRGVSSVAKAKRPKEYEELRLLIIMAKQLAEERKIKL